MLLGVNPRRRSLINERTITGRTVAVDDARNMRGVVHRGFDDRPTVERAKKACVRRGIGAVWRGSGGAPGTLHLSIRDDGVGGADPARGSGLIGLQDRVEAIGTIAVASPIGAGTAVSVSLPLDQPVADGAASLTRARTQG
jgi:hypothetical protein